MQHSANSGPRKRLNAETILGIILTALAALFLFYLAPNHIGTPPFLDNPLMSPRWLPILCGWGVLLLSIGLLIQGLVAPPQESTEPLVEKGVGVTRWLLMILAFLLYMMFFEYLGAILAGIIATALLFFADGIRRWRVYSLAIIFPVLVSMIFIYGLNVPLPPGDIWS